MTTKEKLQKIVMLKENLAQDNFDSYEKKQDGVFFGKNVTIEPYVFFDTSGGNIVIGNDTQIKSGAVLRGPLLVGEHCKLGGEIQHSIFENYSNKAHHGYVGYSYIGSWVNIGGGTSIATLKNTYGTIKMMGEETGQQFLGAILGDCVKTAVNTSIFCGRIIGPASHLYGTVTEDVPAFTSHVAPGNMYELPLDVAIKGQKVMMSRRDKEFTASDEMEVHKLFIDTVPDREKAGVKKKSYDLHKIMKALVKRKPNDPKNWYVGLDIVDRPEPKVSADRQVKVKTLMGGICGTDLQIYLGKESTGGYFKNLKGADVVLGHEFCGEIVEVLESGKLLLAEVLKSIHTTTPVVKKYLENSTANEIAKREDFVSFLNKNFYVAGEMHFTCGNCLQCRSGEEHVCKNTIGKGIHEDGAFTDYLVLPSNRIVFFEKGEIAPEIIAFSDALGNAVHVAHSADITGKTILITGAGVQGLMSLAVAHQMGAGRIYVTDAMPKDHTGIDKLAIARKLGATATFDVAKEEDRKALAEQVKNDTDNTGVDIVFEMSGNYRAYDQAFELIRMGGTMLLLGLPPGKMEVDFSKEIIFKGLTIKGIYGRKIWKTWGLMITLLRNGLAKTILDSGIITHQYSLADYDKGFQALIHGDAIKVLLKP